MTENDTKPDATPTENGPAATSPTSPATGSMAESAAPIPVEVAYALPDKQKIVPLNVAPGTTALGAARQSGITESFPGLVLEGAKLGVFSKPVEPDHVLQAGDRVEIYRPLIIDPKEVRKQRAEEAKRRRAEEE